MVAGSEFAFTLREVKRTTVALGITRNEVDHKGGNGNDMPTENVPTLDGLLLADFRKTHRAGEGNHREHHHTDGELIGDDLCARAHSTDESIFVVGRPTGEQNAHYADTTHGKEEENADVEVDDLCSLVPRQTSKSGHRSRYH